MTVTILVQLEFFGRGNGWQGMDAAIHKPSGIECSRGIRGAGPADRIASTGIMTFALINSEANDAGIEGFYTPGGPNVRGGFETGIRARALLTDNATFSVPIWHGVVTRIEPQAGRMLDRLTFVECRDFMDSLARHRLSDLAVAETITEHDVFDDIIDSMPLRPAAVQATAGPDTYDYAFDLTRDESTLALQEMQRLAQSSLALIYQRGDGTLVYEPRNLYRAYPGEPIITLTEADLRNRLPVVVDDATFDRVTRVQTMMTLRAESISQVVYRATAPLSIRTVSLNAGPVVVSGQFTDPSSREERAAGLDLIPPVAGTDYVFNTLKDGTGTDVTAQVDVTAVFSGNSVKFTITNSSGATAWATTLQARGTVLLAQERITFEAEDAELINEIGDNAISLDMPYQSDVAVAQESAQWLLHVLSEDTKYLRAVPIYLDPSDTTRLLLIARREISDLFALSETMTGLTGAERYFINAIDFSQRPDGTVWVFWTPVPADPTVFWNLSVVDYSELDLTTNLGFGFIIGHQDVAHWDSHDDVSHGDVSHDDTHGDVAHSDAAHLDVAHQDVGHQDVSHADTHGDVAHSDVTHVDTAHTDSHVDQPHIDQHLDVHGDESPHFDSHQDTAHGDVTHQDVAHGDTPHSDSHTDTHSDTLHVDSHTDSGHGDAAHDDVTHTDTHTDVTHTDVEHTDEHGDAAHGDAN